MDELIRKQDALDAIHCDITVTGRQNAELVAATIGAFADRIKALPPVQPTIIYCMDCKYFCKKSGFCTLGTGRFVYEEDFCSQAEKRGNEDGTD